MNLRRLLGRADAASIWCFAIAAVVVEARWIAMAITEPAVETPRPGLGWWITAMFLWLSQLWIAPSIAFLARKLLGIGWHGARQSAFLTGIGLVCGGVPYLRWPEPPTLVRGRAEALGSRRGRGPSSAGRVT